jgi:hypothetical protein
MHQLDAGLVQFVWAPAPGGFKKARSFLGQRYWLES